MIARLLYRIDDLLPELAKNIPQGIEWREFITRMLRMSYTSDILGPLCNDKPKWISETAYQKIHVNANFEIHKGNKDWHRVLFNDICSEAKKNQEEFMKYFVNKIRFSHTAFYVQLGRPDKIIITQ